MLTALREALAWSRLGELRAATGSQGDGAWTAYKAARAHCDENDDGRTPMVTEVSGDGTLPDWRTPPDDDDVPF